MKKKITFIIILLFVFIACKKDNTEPENDSPTYFSFKGTIGTNDNSTVVSYDNNLVICGNNDDKISLIKVTKSGDKVWRNDFYTGNMSTASGVIETENGNLFICGHTYRNWDVSRIDILLVKTNKDGDTIFTRTYGGTEPEYGKCIKKTSDGNILITGKTESFGAGSLGDIYLLKLDYNGDTLWTKSYPDPGQEVPFHLLETKNGEYLVTGTNEDDNNPREIYLLKVDANGTKLWNKKIGPPTWKWGYSTIELSNSELLICGQHTVGEGYSQVLVVKTDNLGNTIWEKEFGEDKISEKGNSIKQNLNGSFTITGSSYDVTTMRDDIILLKIDQTGNQVWFKKFGSSKTDWGMNLIKDINDDNLITGDYNIGGSDYNIFITRTDKDGNFK
jgi:hypothetical protein